MVWQNAVSCPRCGKKGRAYHTVRGTRWRRCLVEGCGYSWRTQEVLQSQADEFSVWYEQQQLEGGPAVQSLIDAVQEVLYRAQGVTSALGLEEVSNGGNGP